MRDNGFVTGVDPFFAVFVANNTKNNVVKTNEALIATPNTLVHVTLQR